MEYIHLLKDANLKATPQRISVLRALGKHEHPTIDELYENIKKEYPTISLATVYKNLNTLIDEKLVIEINVPNQKTKYDIYEEPHIHIVCEKCGNIHDIYQEFLSDYQGILEEKINNKISRLSVVATTPTCKKCGH